MRDRTAGAHPLDDDYDWAHAFQVAGPPEGDDFAENTPDLRRAHPQDAKTPLTPFQRSDIEDVIAYSEGENDGDDWICLGKLKDGRHFMLRAGCDYTGWDCQSGGNVDVASDLGALIAYGITAEEKRRLGLVGGEED